MADFETRNSGTRAEYSTGMVRDTDEGKPRFDLIEPVGMPLEKTMRYRRASLMARGASYYGDRNWEKARTPEELARFLGSADRHYAQWRAQILHRSLELGDGAAFDLSEEVAAEDHGAATQYNMDAAEYVLYRMGQVAPAEPLEGRRGAPFVDCPDLREDAIFDFTDANGVKFRERVLEVKPDGSYVTQSEPGVEEGLTCNGRDYLTGQPCSEVSWHDGLCNSGYDPVDESTGDEWGACAERHRRLDGAGYASCVRKQGHTGEHDHRLIWAGR